MDCKFRAMLFPHAHNFIVFKPVKMDVGLGGRVIIYITCFSTKREKDNKSETQSGTGSATLMICMHSNSTWIFSISDLSFIMPECSLKFCKGRKKLKRFPRDEVVREKWTLFCGRESSWRPGTGARLCAAHFKQRCFTCLKRVHLKPRAAPTIKGVVTEWTKNMFLKIHFWAQYGPFSSPCLDLQSFIFFSYSKDGDLKIFCVHGVIQRFS